MPMYEYKCHGCGKLFEARQNFSDAPLSRHEECGGGEVERLISVPSLQFKGSGFYITDYAKGGSGGAKTPPPSKSDNKSDGGAKPDSASSSTSDSSKSTASSTTSSSNGGDSKP